MDHFRLLVLWNRVSCEPASFRFPVRVAEQVVRIAIAGHFIAASEIVLSLVSFNATEQGLVVLVGMHRDWTSALLAGARTRDRLTASDRGGGLIYTVFDADDDAFFDMLAAECRSADVSNVWEGANVCELHVAGQTAALQRAADYGLSHVSQGECLLTPSFDCSTLAIH